MTPVQKRIGSAHNSGPYRSNHSGAAIGSTQSSLLFKARKKQPDAWRRLVHDYSPLLYDYCRMQRLSPETAADIVQETLLAVYKSLDSFKKEKKNDGFRKWILAIARHKAIDYARAFNWQQAEGGTNALMRLEQLADERVGPISSAEFVTPAPQQPNSQSLCLLRRALTLIEGDFQPSTWRAFWRTAIDGQNAAETANELGLSHDAVRKAKSRVISRLKEEQARLEREDAP